MPDFDAFYERLRTRQATCRRRRSRRSATSSRSTSRCSRPATTSSRSTCRPGSPARTTARCRPRRSSRSAGYARAHRGARLGDRVRRAGRRRARRGRAGARGRRARTRSSRTRATAREQLKLWFAVDTLEYLRRGGRVGAAQAWLGGALKIKPILSIESRDHADRARAHVGQGVRADGRLHALARRRRRRRRGSSSTSRRPTQAERLVERGPRDLRLRAALRLRGRAGHRRPRRARACSASAACPPRYLQLGAVRPRGRRPLPVRNISIPRLVFQAVLVVVAVVLALYLVYLLRKPIGWVLLAGFLALALAGAGQLLSRADAARLRDHDRLPRAAGDPAPARR